MPNTIEGPPDCLHANFINRFPLPLRVRALLQLAPLAPDVPSRKYLTLATSPQPTHSCPSASDEHTNCAIPRGSTMSATARPQQTASTAPNMSHKLPSSAHRKHSVRTSETGSSNTRTRSTSRLFIPTTNAVTKNATSQSMTSTQMALANVIIATLALLTMASSICTQVAAQSAIGGNIDAGLVSTVLPADRSSMSAEPDADSPSPTVIVRGFLVSSYEPLYECASYSALFS